MVHGSIGRLKCDTMPNLVV